MGSESSSTSATPPDSGDTGVWADMLLVGVVARAHGNRGEVVVNATTDFPETRFAEGAVVWGRRRDGEPARALCVRSVRMHLGRPVVAFDESATIDDAERYAGMELRVPASARQPLPDGVYYHHDLVGCEAWTASGERIGVVRAVEGAGQAVRLVIAGRRGEVLVPLAEELCRVDVSGRRVEVTPPEGLLDLNGAWRE